MKEKLYLKTWFICLMFALWPSMITPIVGVVLLFMKNKVDTERNKKYGEIEQLEVTINTNKEEARSIINKANSDVATINGELSILKREKQAIENDLKNLNKQLTIEAINISNYDNITSEECKNQLALLKIDETELIKNDKALIITSTDTKKVLNNNIKQILRCFNSECSNITTNLTVKNVEASRSKMIKSYETLNSIFSTDGLKITNDLLEIKLKELSLIYAYQLKKEQEKDQQKAIKEQMAEEEKVRREIENEKKKIEKEENQFKNEVSKLISYLNKSNSEVEQNLYAEKIRELEEKLKLLEKDKENVFQREQNTRAGFVYVISNIGSFGEGVFKIGMTRRLEPMDRIKELSNASVPFDFDVHAMIFSEDAPALETTLHQTFRDQEVNKVNSRKEFFRVSLREVADVVKRSHNSTVEFTMIAEAMQYREGLRISQQSIA